MKWMLLIILFNGQPVETKVFYDSLRECYEALSPIEMSRLDLYDEYRKLMLQGSFSDDERKTLERRLKMQVGLGNRYTCIPYEN